MPESESVHARLLKVLRLAQSGVGGERDNAAVLLEKLLRKHSMTLADLEGATDQPRALAWLAASDVDERTVLSQLAISLFGTDRKHWSRTGSTQLGIDVTPSEHAALTIAWEVYRAAFVEARHALVLGFCYKHGLFAQEGNAAPDMSTEARQRAERAIALAEALPVVDSPSRRIGNGGEA